MFFPWRNSLTHRLESGQQFGMLRVLGQEGKNKHGRILWRCACDCGNSTVVQATYLVKGITQSCGCLKTSGNSRRTHGKSGTQVHWAWKAMKARCRNSNRPQWKDYGGRGITYDPAWESFEQFFLDMGNPPGPEYSLDRINNNKGYSKKNCRWATRDVQRMNSRAPIRWVKIKGERMVLADAVKKYGAVPYDLVTSRLHNGWSEEDAILLPRTSRWARRGTNAGNTKRKKKSL